MRTDAETVKKIITTGLGDDAINTFIEAANAFVDNTLKSKLNNDTLAKIETWISAHLIAISRERNQSAIDMGAGGAYIKYSDEFGMGLNQSTYGQSAIMFDTTGTLRDITDNKKKPKFKAIPND